MQSKMEPQTGSCKDLEQTIETAKHIMLCGKSKGDYHKNIDGEKEYKFFKNRLIPAFNARFPNCILTLFP